MSKDIKRREGEISCLWGEIGKKSKGCPAESLKEVVRESMNESRSVRKAVGRGREV